MPATYTQLIKELDALRKQPSSWVKKAIARTACANSLQLCASGWFNSPIADTDGNREFLIRITHGSY